MTKRRAKDWARKFAELYVNHYATADRTEPAYTWAERQAEAVSPENAGEFAHQFQQWLDIRTEHMVVDWDRKKAWRFAYEFAYNEAKRWSERSHPPRPRPSA